MDEEIFNMQLRRFLKKVGIQSQRDIELAVRQGIETGTLASTDKTKCTGIAPGSRSGPQSNHRGRNRTVLRFQFNYSSNSLRATAITHDGDLFEVDREVTLTYYEYYSISLTPALWNLVVD